jgi:hypothetical protein
MRRVVIAVASLAIATPAATPSAAAPKVTVYKNPTCECCGRWVAHLRAHGFSVVAFDVDDLAEVRARLGVPFRLASCHTASVGGKVIEGHVPADLIEQLLAKGGAAGLSVPGMVTGSPGMEGPGAQPYDVIAWDRQGKTRVYARR